MQKNEVKWNSENFPGDSHGRLGNYIRINWNEIIHAPTVKVPVKESSLV